MVHLIKHSMEACQNNQEKSQLSITFKQVPLHSQEFPEDLRVKPFRASTVKLLKCESFESILLLPLAFFNSATVIQIFHLYHAMWFAKYFHKHYLILSFNILQSRSFADLTGRERGQYTVRKAQHRCKKIEFQLPGDFGSLLLVEKIKMFLGRDGQLCHMRTQSTTKQYGQTAGGSETVIGGLLRTGSV